MLFSFDKIPLVSGSGNCVTQSYVLRYEESPSSTGQDNG